jgi:hypothetical protein
MRVERRRIDGSDGVAPPLFRGLGRPRPGTPRPFARVFSCQPRRPKPKAVRGAPREAEDFAGPLSSHAALHWKTTVFEPSTLVVMVETARRDPLLAQ